MLNVIVGFKIEIIDIQAKFKLSQSRNQTETAVATLMPTANDVKGC